MYSQLIFLLVFPRLLNFPQIVFCKTCFVFPIFIWGEKFFLLLLLFIGGVAYILYRAGFICFLDSLFSLDFCCVCFLFTLYLSCLCQYMTKMGRNRWNMGILFILFRESWNFFWKGERIRKKIVLFSGRWNCFARESINFFFNVSNLGGRVSLLLFLYLFFILFICFSFHTCVDVFFWVFQERQVFWSRSYISSCNF